MRHSPLQVAALRAAGWRGHALVLLYHRIRADGDLPRDEVTPSVERRVLRAQLQALAEMGDIVELARVLDPPLDRRRPRFAITFDDDYPQHVAHALPVLREVGIRAAFFLSGRALHGLGPYWWEILEALVAAHGAAAAGRALGIVGDSAQALALVCETDARVCRRLVDMGRDAKLSALHIEGIRALAEAGMTLGFHTLEHPLLPTLDDERLAAALTQGRTELAALIGKPITLLAYPHGKADRRVAQAARIAGYRAAWTGSPRLVRTGDDPFLLGRWEPGPLDGDAFVAAVAVRLHRAAPGH
jgi:peptidoglycan/xylan/chitin deacetylase (PgdA/CDA1 family)